MVEPLTDVEKQEYYEIYVHLNTFTLDRNQIGYINPLGITLIVAEQQKYQTYWNGQN